MTDGTNDAAQEMKAKASDTLADVAEQVAGTSGDTQAQMQESSVNRGTSGSVSEGGFDFVRARAAVQVSDLSAGAKAKVIAVLATLQEAPGAFEEKINAYKALLNT